MTDIVSFVASARPILELLYFVAGILLTIGLGFTYLQLRMLKHDLNTKNVRSAREKALEACDRYFDRYVPLTNKYLEDRGNLPTYEGPIGDFSDASIPATFRDFAKERFKIYSWVAAINQLEFIAAHFCSEVADEQAAFPIIGRSYVRTVELHYDLLALSHSNKASPYYHSIIELYSIWKTRLQSAELNQKKSEISKDISNLPVSKSISTIGMKK